MKVLVLYRPNSEFARHVEGFVHDLQARYNVDQQHLEILDFDSREGSATASLYDVLSQPSIIVIADDGAFIKSWQGDELPLLDEVAGYALSYQ